MKPETTSHQEEPKTIRELLARTVNDADASGKNAHYLGEGHFAKGYRLSNDIPELRDYVLRVCKPNGWDEDTSYIDRYNRALKESSSLTPPKKIACGENIGQPLLTLDSGETITILPMQQGVSVKSIIQKHLEKRKEPEAKTALRSQEAEAKADAIEELLSLSAPSGSPNPLLSIFNKARSLMHIGYFPDLAANNIFLNRENNAFGLIDYHTRNPYSTKSHNNILKEEAYRFLCEFEIEDEDNSRETARYKRQFSILEAAVNNAVKQAIFENKANPDNKKLSFANVSDVKAISLDDPPHVLVETLRELQKRTNTAARS